MIFNSKKELQKYFDMIVEEIDSQIVKVCTFPYADSNAYLPIVYRMNDSLYIIFENGKALVINYFNVYEIDVDYRDMTEEEKKNTSQIDCADFFNRVDDIYDYDTSKLSKRIIMNMDYGKLNKVVLQNYSGEYDYWYNGKVVTYTANNDNFGKLKLITDNNNIIDIIPKIDVLDSWTVSSDTVCDIIRTFNC
ncbi:MAG: hypothetical protein IJO54_02025 [Oscillospiraceae bacterium]|nr:hypothetical protein [Oscillospiraceae bacterium]